MMGMYELASLILHLDLLPDFTHPVVRRYKLAVIKCKIPQFQYAVRIKSATGQKDIADLATPDTYGSGEVWLKPEPSVHHGMIFPAEQWINPFDRCILPIGSHEIQLRHEQPVTCQVKRAIKAIFTVITNG
jgi:hypothetical protein